MTFLPIIAAAAMALPLGATAQSLHDTHEVVWHPAGKTPAMTYRVKGTPACAATAEHHRAGRGQMTPANRCVVRVATPAAPAVAR